MAWHSRSDQPVDLTGATLPMHYSVAPPKLVPIGLFLIASVFVIVPIGLGVQLAAQDHVSWFFLPMLALPMAIAAVVARLGAEAWCYRESLTITDTTIAYERVGFRCREAWEESRDRYLGLMADQIRRGSHEDGYVWFTLDLQHESDRSRHARVFASRHRAAMQRAMHEAPGTFGTEVVGGDFIPIDYPTVADMLRS